MINETVTPSLPNLKIHIYNSPSETSNEHICDFHIHNEFEILRVFKGQIDYYINDESIELKAGDVIFVNSRVPHKTLTHINTVNSLIQFSLDIEPGDINVSKFLMRFINFRDNDYVLLKYGTPKNTEISEYILKIYKEFSAKEKSYELYIKGSIYNILAFLYRNEILSDPRKNLDTKNFEQLRPALQYIENHYNENIDLSDLSNILNINKSYFCRLFRKTINTTFVQYLNFVRICNAEKLLITTSKSISDISFDTGFSSIYYFNRIFKKYKHCTPTVFKKLCK